MRPVARMAVQVATKMNVWVYRRTDGRVGGRGMGGLPLLLLTVPGAAQRNAVHRAGCLLRT